MTRKQAIRELKIQFVGEYDRQREAKDMAIKALEQEPRWIPVSERLPKVADCYTVTRKIGDDLIVDACFFDGINTWHNDNRINHERNYLTDIIAWMPLPKTYEPQESEDKE
jgi:hypothetical protein